ncbi:ion transporter [bacterium]|nr:ion transporter [bacterium]
MIKQKLHDIIFEAETPAGKLFDIALIVCILLSVSTVILDSVSSLNQIYGDLFYTLEWTFTIIFSIEYVLRLWCVEKPTKYATSFFGVIDLLSILPTYFSLLLPGSQYLLVVRLLRVLRIFRVLKLVQFVNESKLLMTGLKESARKIFIFICAVLTLVIILGSIIYSIEGAENGFTSIPKSIYWAIVTLTTVGYGDMAPSTNLGQFIASAVMIMGYAIIAVPAGIVSSELTNLQQKDVSTLVCPHCTSEGHDSDAKHCKFCGEKL